LAVEERWYPSTALDDLLVIGEGKINDTRLYRCLDRILPHKTKLERHLKQRYGELFGAEFDVLLYDLTSTYVEGAAEKNPRIRRGYSRDHRPDCQQMVIALIVWPRLRDSVLQDSVAKIWRTCYHLGMHRTEQGQPWPLPYALLKFGKEQHIQEFRNDGLLFMQPLSTFAKLESDTVRGDCLEGTTHIYQPKDLTLTIDTGRADLGKFTAKPSDLNGVRIRLNKTASCNVYCMFAVTKPVDGELVSSQNLAFGDSCVIVLDTAEFLSRVIRVAEDQGVSCLEWGLVEYYNADEYSGETGALPEAFNVCLSKRVPNCCRASLPSAERAPRW